MLSVFDILGGALCLLVFGLIFNIKVKKYPARERKLFRRAFFFKIVCSIIFALISAYYYKGGDTEMYLYATRDVKAAIQSNDLALRDLLLMEKSRDNHPISYYFLMDNTKYPVYGFMQSAGNFMVPKLGIGPFLIFLNSYFALCFVFSFFALAGLIRLYKLLLYYFPNMHREIAVATLFLPSACYWSAGFLKDPICFGSIGFLLYGLFNIFIRKRKYLSSLFWVAISIYFLYTIKVYILLALIPGIAFWLFGEVNTVITNPSLRKFFTTLSLIIAGVGAFILVNYLTSEKSLAKFSMDNLLESSDFSRDIYALNKGEGSAFQYTTTNPALLMLNGLVATFFRPFPWEITSFIVLFSAVESLLFLSLIGFLFFKKGIISPIRKIFSSPILILAFSFAIIFAIAVGISTTNFGSLSRYKIPCLPFYLMFVLGAYQLSGLAYPIWMQRILKFVTK